MTGNDGFVVGLIGAGIKKSLSPALHEVEGKNLGVDYRYELFDLDDLRLSPEEAISLIHELRGKGYAGVNVTHPCKRIAIDAVDELSPEAAQIGAINTIVFTGDTTTGFNTDLFGFREGFLRGLDEPEIGSVVVVGAGGAGSAVTHAMLDLGTTELTIFDVDAQQSACLALAGRKAFPDTSIRAEPLDALADVIATVDGVVHATPVGMIGHPGVAVPLHTLRPELWIAEVVYRPLETELLRHARRLGSPTVDGGGMAVFQAVEAFRLFTRREPDSERMLRHFAELIGAEPSEEDVLALA